MSALLFARRSALLTRLPAALSRRLMATSFGNNCPLALSPKQLHELREEASDNGLVVLDASWHMPNSPRNAKTEFSAASIPLARYLDLDEVASPHDLGLKHMMPTGDFFAQACTRFGIERDTHVVLYDSHGVFSSPRALFMFRAFGHTRSSILDGGLPNWKAHGYPTLPGSATPVVKNARYDPPSLDTSFIRGYEQMVTNAAFDPSSAETELVIDARSRGRYLGTEPEPRPGLPSGHIPHSRSLPFTAFLQQNTDNLSPGTEPQTFTTLASSERIIAALEDALGPEYAKDVLAGKRGIVTSCGSGMTAAILWLGLQQLGVQRIGLYDESWTGYAVRDGSPIAKGE